MQRSTLAPSKLLRRVLRINALFSGLSGLAFAVPSRALPTLAGLPSSELINLGLGLLVFSAFLWVLSSRERDLTRGWAKKAAWGVAVLDGLWVVDTVVSLVSSDLYTTTGRVLFGMLALVVLGFAEVQFYALWKLRRRKGGSTQPSAVTFMLLMMTGAFLAGGCTTADLRSDQLKREGYTEAAAQKGRMLLERAAQQHGIESWRSFSTVETVSTDTWPSGWRHTMFGWWEVEQQRLRSQQLLGTFTSRVELLNGPHRGESWGIQAWRGYKKTATEEVAYVQEPILTFYLPTLHYFNEMPFRVLSAEYVAYAGEGTLNGTTYDRVYVTWGSVMPNLEHDQYELWINQETGLIEICHYTLRDAYDWATGTIHFGDYREVQGVMFPFTQTVVLEKPEDTRFPLDEHFFHQSRFESVVFDAVEQDRLIVDAGRPVGDVKPSGYDAMDGVVR